jgi:hypothetical protein
MRVMIQFKNKTWRLKYSVVFPLEVGIPHSVRASEVALIHVRDWGLGLYHVQTLYAAAYAMGAKGSLPLT